jgi:hypothetical protein
MQLEMREKRVEVERPFPITASPGSAIKDQSGSMFAHVKIPSPSMVWAVSASPAVDHDLMLQ